MIKVKRACISVLARDGTTDNNNRINKRKEPVKFYGGWLSLWLWNQRSQEQLNNATPGWREKDDDGGQLSPRLLTTATADSLTIQQIRRVKSFRVSWSLVDRDDKRQRARSRQSAWFYNCNPRIIISGNNNNGAQKKVPVDKWSQKTHSF